MSRDDIDRSLSDDDPIAPSSGFTESVMEAVHREASVHQGLPFPWRRAVPGFIAIALTLVSMLVVGIWAAANASPSPAGASSALLDLTIDPAIAWLALAVALAVAPVLWALRLMRTRA